MAVHMAETLGSYVTATDLPYCSELCKATIGANRMGGRVKFVELDWSMRKKPILGCDVVVAADCVWIESLVAPFLKTFKHYLEASIEQVGIIAHQVRGGGGEIEDRIVRFFKEGGWECTRDGWVDEEYPESRLCVFIIQRC